MQTVHEEYGKYEDVERQGYNKNHWNKEVDFVNLMIKVNILELILKLFKFFGGIEPRRMK